MNETKEIELLKLGDSTVLKTLYLNYRADFIAFGKKLTTDEEDILDCYQDAIVILQEQAYKGKLDALTCSLKTYLFGIGKYMIYDKNRRKSKMILKTVEDNEIEVVKVDLFSETMTNQQQLIKKGFESLGKKCRLLLQLFYYRGYDLDDITAHLNYENKNVVKSQKSRCLKQLKQLVKDIT